MRHRDQTQANPTQASPIQASPIQASPTQASPTQASPTQASPTQAVSSQFGPAQASATEASATQANATQARATEAGPAVHAADSWSNPAPALIEPTKTSLPQPGRHRAPVLPMPHVPAQKRPDQKIPTQLVPSHEERVVTPVEPVSDVAPVIPETAQWRASQLPRLCVATLLVLTAVGTSGLGVRYAESRGADDFVSLVIGLGVVVVLWAILIASTPQVVRLNGSVLTVHNSGGTQRFDLADGLQAVEVVGDPKTSRWAVLLHRPNSSTVVLRGHDVKAFELDPIVRHYRAVASRRGADRDTRFNR